MRTVFLNGIRILSIILALFTAACGGGDSYDPPTHFEMSGREFMDTFKHHFLYISLRHPDHEFTELVSATENDENTLATNIIMNGLTSVWLKMYEDPSNNNMLKRVQVILYEDPRGRPAWEVKDMSKWQGAVLDATSVLLNIGVENEEEMLLDHSELENKIQEKIDNNLLSDAVRYKGLNYQLSFDDSVEPPVFSVTISY